MSTPRYIDRYKSQPAGYINHQASASTNNEGWQIRIPIPPESLEKAVPLLSPLLEGENFKFIKLERTNSWDGILGEDSKGDTDRDQRGKECCIYMDDPKTPEHWKQLILNCWKVLAEAGIQLGYTVPFGDKPILLSSGLETPFSYSADKPFRGRHGILHENNYNPSGHKDPLENLKITESDLKKHNINFKNRQGTLDNLNKHHTESVQYLSNQLDTIFKDEKDTKDMINDFKKNTEEKETSVLKKIDEMDITKLPHASKTKLESIITSPSNLINKHKTNLLRLMEKNKDSDLSESISTQNSLYGLQQVVLELKKPLESKEKTDDNEKLINALDSCINDINDYQKKLPSFVEKLEQERKGIIDDFVNLLLDEKNKSSDVMSLFSKKLNIQKDDSLKKVQEKLDKAVGKNPYEMQKLYRKIVHTLHEENLINQIKQNHNLHFIAMASKELPKDFKSTVLTSTMSCNKALDLLFISLESELKNTQTIHSNSQMKTIITDFLARIDKLNQNYGSKNNYREENLLDKKIDFLIKLKESFVSESKKTEDATGKKKSFFSKKPLTPSEQKGILEERINALNKMKGVKPSTGLT